MVVMVLSGGEETFKNSRILLEPQGAHYKHDARVLLPRLLLREALHHFRLPLRDHDGDPMDQDSEPEAPQTTPTLRTGTEALGDQGFCPEPRTSSSGHWPTCRA
jgi:hypothetical protein